MKKTVMFVLIIFPTLSQATSNIFQVKCGMNNPLSNIQDTTTKDGGTSVALEGDLLTPLDKHTSIGLSVLYADRAKINTYELVNGANVSLDGYTLSGMFMVKFLLKPDQSITPFIQTGIGFATSFIESYATPNTGNYWGDTGLSNPRLLISEYKTSPIFSIGGGINIKSTEKVSWIFEGNYTKTASSEFETHPLAGQTLKINHSFESFNLIVGLAFRMPNALCLD